jgi:hypothetical protein
VGFVGAKIKEVRHAVVSNEQVCRADAYHESGKHGCDCIIWHSVLWLWHHGYIGFVITPKGAHCYIVQGNTDFCCCRTQRTPPTISVAHGLPNFVRVTSAKAVTLHCCWICWSFAGLQGTNTSGPKFNRTVQPVESGGKFQGSICGKETLVQDWLPKVLLCQ